MDVTSITIFGVVFAIFVGFSSIVADTSQVADYMEKRRKKNQKISKEAENCELVEEKLNEGFTNKQEESVLPADFSRDVENLFPTRREGLNSPSSLARKGAGGLDLALVFPHDVKSQVLPELLKSNPPLGWEEDIKKSFAEARENLKSKEMTFKDGKKILIVDDEYMMLGNLQEFLEIEGYEVFSAENAESAFKILEHEIPDLIISDVMMPGINGYEFTKVVRKTPHLGWIPIILMSAYKCKSIDRVNGLNAGAVAYLNKPFNPTEFIAQVKSSLKQTEILINRISAL